LKFIQVIALLKPAILFALALTLLTACGKDAPATPVPATATPAPTATAAPSPTPFVIEPGHDPGQTMYALMDAGMPGPSSVGPSPHDRLRQALASATRNRDTSQAPVLVELLRLVPSQQFREDITAALLVLTGLEAGAAPAGWLEWEEWLGLNLVDYLPPKGYGAWKAELYWRLDPALGDLLVGMEETARIDLTELLWSGARLGDVAPLDSPRSVPASAARFMLPTDRVIGVSIDGEHRAYPLRIMAAHEAANDELADERIAVAYCPLCGSGNVFSANLNRSDLEFGSAALVYRSSSLLYDHATRTVWSQLTGEAVIGPLAVEREVLRRYPSVMTTWAEWMGEHPDTTVLDIDTGLAPPEAYPPGPRTDSIYYGYVESESLLFPVWNRSAALPLKEMVFVVREEDQLGVAYKAYPLSVMRRKRIVNDRIGQTDYIVVASANTDSVKVYERRGRYFTITGSVAFSGGFPTELIDRTSGARWTIGEDAMVRVDDPGKNVDRLPGVTSYWFAWHTIHPDTRVYTFDEGG